jgi:hypothetical protein
MRLHVSGPHRTVVGIKRRFEHEKIGVKTDSESPEVRVFVTTCGEIAPQIASGDKRLEALLLDQLEEFNVKQTVVLRDSSLSGLDLVVGLPKDTTEYVEVAMEQAIFRAILIRTGMTAKSIIQTRTGLVSL